MIARTTLVLMLVIALVAAGFCLHYLGRRANLNRELRAAMTDGTVEPPPDAADMDFALDMAAAWGEETINKSLLISASFFVVSLGLAGVIAAASRRAAPRRSPLQRPLRR